MSYIDYAKGDKALFLSGKKSQRQDTLKFLEKERRIAESILSKEDCSSDCYKCELIGGSTLKLIDRLTAFLNGEEND